MKVSVAVITYNHEKYIAQAIDSAINQKTDFDYEIVISDDCSTDNTGEIIKKYAKRYPRKVKICFNDKNLGANKNYIQTLKMCNGEYIANLEGDDFWTDTKKLKKQVDFLDSRQDCEFCFHLVEKRFEDLNSHYVVMPDESKRRDLIFRDFIPDNFLGTCSVVFRNYRIKKWPDWAEKISMLDWPLYLLLLENGKKAGFINETMGVYRVHSGGVISGKPLTQNYLNTIQALSIINKHYKYRYNKIFLNSIFQIRILLASDAYIRKKYCLVCSNLIQMFKIKILHFPFSKIKVSWLSGLYLINSARPSWFSSKTVEGIRLIRNFKDSCQQNGWLISLKKVFNYILKICRHKIS